MTVEDATLSVAIQIIQVSTVSAAALLEKVVGAIGDCCEDELLTLLPPALVLTPSAMSATSLLAAFARYL